MLEVIKTDLNYMSPVKSPVRSPSKSELIGEYFDSMNPKV